MSASRRGVPTLPVELLRDAVGREVARLSLRGAAKAIAVSPNGLRNFLNGSAPRTATRTKLERWLASQERPSRPPRVGPPVRLLSEPSADLSPQQSEPRRRAVTPPPPDASPPPRLSSPPFV